MATLLFVYGVLYIGAVGLALIVLSNVLGERPSFRIGHLVIVAIIGLIIAAYVGTRNESMTANFFQHAVGGGFVTGLLTLSVLHSFKLRLSKLETVTIIIASVSVFGIANELLEFFLQSTTSLRFANDAADTWRDLTANMSGAMLASLVVLTAQKDSPHA